MQRDARWYVTDDRFTYKPGETVYVKGWVRWTDNGVNPDLALPRRAARPSTYTLVDARGNKIAHGHGGARPTQGGFDVEVDAAADAEPRHGADVHARDARRDATRIRSQIQEFRTPAYAVSLDDDVTHAGATPLVLGESIEMRAEAKYYAGGGLAGAAIRWDAQLERRRRYRAAGLGAATRSSRRIRARCLRYDAARRRGAPARDAVRRVDGDERVRDRRRCRLDQPSRADGRRDRDRRRSHDHPRELARDPRAPEQRTTSACASIPDRATRLEAIVTDIDGAPVAGVPIDVAIEGVLGSERVPRRREDRRHPALQADERRTRR